MNIEGIDHGRVGSMSLGLFGHPTVAEVRMLTATRRDVGPLQALLESISNKWVATVLELLTGARELSYGELHRRTNGVSRKMLSATLRHLVRDGLVQRRTTPRGEPTTVPSN
jgi:DNA-binding HxlR family transcriptional regulator